MWKMVITVVSVAHTVGMQYIEVKGVGIHGGKADLLLRDSENTCPADQRARVF